MATFQVKSDLTVAQRKEIDRISAISAALRTTEESAFLTALAPYLTNQIILSDENGLIVVAAGETLPTSYSGFSTGAIFIDLSTGVVYTNLGDSTTADWDTRDSVGEDTPVNSAIATQTLTSDETAPSDGDEIVIGDVTYTARTALTTDPDTVPYEVLIGASAAAFLDNLKLAINAGDGAGTNYSTGTVAHPLVTATTNTDTTQIIEAKTGGAAANEIATTETSDHLSWGDDVMAGGVDGTPGIKGMMLFDDTNLYIATQDNTISDAVWRKIAHSALE